MDYSALNDVLSNRQDVDFFGVDEEGPVPLEQTTNNVEVAEIPYDLTNVQAEAVDEIRQRYSTDVDGITCYLQVFWISIQKTNVSEKVTKPMALLTKSRFCHFQKHLMHKI